MIRHIIIVFFCFFLFLKGWSQTTEQGIYFSKKKYEKHALPAYSDAINYLPSPILDEKPLWIETYWKAWEIAFKHLYEPTTENGFISQYIDAAFNNYIFLWDTSFITMFGNYGYPVVPGISSLDNFYAKQHASGEIGREISRLDGTDCPFWLNKDNKPLYSSWGYNVPDKFEATPIVYKNRKQPKLNPTFTLDGLNHPILAWAEWESYKLTGDKERLAIVYLPLVKYYESLQKYIRQGNGLYMTDWASMDNSTRNPYLIGGGVGIDISCEMTLFANCLSDIAKVLNKKADADKYNSDAKTLGEKINKLMWSDAKGFYFDLTLEEKQVEIKTVAAYWSLIADVASTSKAEKLVEQLNDPNTFYRKNRVPTLAADEEKYSPSGNYWRGSVWAPTTTMVVAGLEKYGYENLARDIAVNHIDLVAEVYKQTGTIWETYSPDSITYARHADGKPVAKDFVGWSGIGPIKFLLEYGIGLKADAINNKLIWTINYDEKVGCDRFRFNGATISLLAEKREGEKRRIIINSDKPFLLEIKWNNENKNIKIKKGRQSFIL